MTDNRRITWIRDEEKYIKEDKDNTEDKYKKNEDNTDGDRYVKKQENNTDAEIHVEKKKTTLMKTNT